MVLSWNVLVVRSLNPSLFAARLAAADSGAVINRHRRPAYRKARIDLSVSSDLRQLSGQSYALTADVHLERVQDEANTHGVDQPTCNEGVAMNKDQVKGRVEEAKGAIKEATGRVTGNANMQDRGTLEKAAGKVQKNYGDVKEQVKEEWKKPA
jgi:uncharacterized protein YjbJ (UPF0337 family)